MSTLERDIEKTIGDVRLDTLDLSFGEFISLCRSKELIIAPEFQRYFRWDEEQRSRLIESIILKLPIPQVFVVENEAGIYELIDGLQRLSSVIQFIDPQLLNLDPLKLIGCDLVSSLDGTTFDALPFALKMQVKRSTVRTVVIKKQSSGTLKFAMFKRLNTGGSDLSEQEIRNCTSRMVGEAGTIFYDFLQKCAREPSFADCTSTLPDGLRDQRGDEELVLRFFALKNGHELFRGSVRDWLDTYMEQVLFNKRPFSYESEWKDFAALFQFLNETLGDSAFVRFRNGKPLGALAPAHYEAITLGVWQALSHVSSMDRRKVQSQLVSTVESETFKRFVGPGSNSQVKFNGRSNTIRDALLELK